MTRRDSARPERHIPGPAPPGSFRLRCSAGLALALAVHSAAGCRVRKESVEAVPDAGAAPAASVAPSSAATTSATPAASVEAPPIDAGDLPQGAIILAFGGLGSDAADPAPEQAAIRVAALALHAGDPPLEAATAAVGVLEESPLRNSGVGSSLRLDGETIEQDAIVMDSKGRLGAVAAVSETRYPARLALAVAGTHEGILSGFQALRLAPSLRVKLAELVTDAARQQYRRTLAEALRDAATGPPVEWRRYVDAGVLEHLLQRLPAAADPRDAGGAAAPADAAVPDAAETQDARPIRRVTRDAGGVPERVMPAAREAGVDAASAGAADAGADTVAVLLRHPDGSFAGAASSGGPVLSLPGRVGDVPIAGAALWVGERGAVAVSGSASWVASERLARAVYERLEVTRSARGAALWGVRKARTTRVAVAAVDARSAAVEPSDAAAWAWLEGEEEHTSVGEVLP